MAETWNGAHAPAEVNAVLRRPGDGLPIPCLSVELTNAGFEIASAEAFEIGDLVELIMANQKVQLRVDALCESTGNSAGKLYRLVAHGSDNGFQEMLHRLAGIQISPDGSKAMTARRGNINGVVARAKRLSSLGLVGAHVKTWGTRFEYQLATVDLSRTGALLVSDGRDSLPFQEGTLLEIRFSTPLLTERREIFCSAKVVRRIESMHESGGKRCQLGVQLIDLDGEVLRHWERLISKVQSMVEPTGSAQADAIAS